MGEVDIGELEKFASEAAAFEKFAKEDAAVEKFAAAVEKEVGKEVVVGPVEGGAVVGLLTAGCWVGGAPGPLAGAWTGVGV